ncbi:cytochrome-c oxidase [Paenibacillus marinisediminis]
MGVRFLKVAVFYFLIGVLAGLVMGSMKAFEYTSMHAHINLIGWVSLALSGLIYVKFPKAGESSLGAVHFWLHNVGLPVFAVGLALEVNDVAVAVPMLIGGGLLIVLAALTLLVNVWKNVSS